MEGVSFEDLKAYLILGGIIALVLFAAIVQPIYMLYKDASSEDALTDAGRKLGFTVRPPGEPTILMRGVYKAHEIVVGTPQDENIVEDLALAAVAGAVLSAALDGANRSSSSTLEVDVPIYVMLSRPLPAGLRIMVQGDPRPRPPHPDLKRVAVGDAYLDERLIIEAQDVDAARALLGRERVRHALRTLLGVTRFAVEKGYITMTQRRKMPDPERLVALLDLLSLAADALEDESDPLRSF